MRCLCLFLILLAAAPFQGVAQMPSPYSREAFVQGTDTLPYRKLLPEGFDATRKYPLILFLHGGGERGSDNEKQLTHGSGLFTSPVNRGAFPAIVLAPQCAASDYWAQVDLDRSSYPIGLEFHYEKGPTRSLGLVMDLLEQYRKAPYVDADRIYVMGLSMGGMGTFELLHRLPGVFAAAIPICGAGVPETVGGYAGKIPLWIFHGAVDQVIAPEHSLDMVQALFDAGARPGFTLYDRVNHNSWDYAFAEPELLPWLFSHRKADR
ncbi:dienelactone hydrolase family protein [Robiginitalea sp. SC105]|nr:dienelactone hydrolase family protein [Robiginitalea sp. SC105]